MSEWTKEIQSNIEYNRFGDRVALTYDEYEWLIEQAERTEKLESENEKLEKELERIKVKYRATKELSYKSQKDCGELESENEWYRRGLEYIRDDYFSFDEPAQVADVADYYLRGETDE